jgi:hypothetical protein
MLGMAYLFRVREVPLSYLGSDLVYLDQDFRGFSQNFFIFAALFLWIFGTEDGGTAWFVRRAPTSVVF